MNSNTKSALSVHAQQGFKGRLMVSLLNCLNHKFVAFATQLLSVTGPIALSLTEGLGTVGHVVEGQFLNALIGILIRFT